MELFEHAFQRPPSVETVGQALASYQRTLISANSPFDRWYYGQQPDALSPQAQAGFHLFTGKAGCGSCHVITPQDALFTDQTFHNTGLGWYNAIIRSRSVAPTPVEVAPGVVVRVAHEIIASVGERPPADLGRYEVTPAPAERWRYKTPTLRNVTVTAPYMHDGSLSTLDELIRPLQLSDAQIAALVAFLESLTGDNLAELIADARSIRVGNVTSSR